MCGACTGGAVISRLTAYAAVTGSNREVLQMLQDTAAPRLLITSSGGQWLVRNRTGHQQVLPDLESVAAAVVSGPVDWAQVHEVTGVRVETAGGLVSCAADEVLNRIEATAVHEQTAELTAGEFVAALLVRAANRVR